MKINVKCDFCGKVFKVRDKNIKVEKLENGYQRTYFLCTELNCRHKYTIAYSSELSRKLQKQWKKEGSRHGTETHRALLKELKKVNDYMRFIGK